MKLHNVPFCKVSLIIFEVSVIDKHFQIWTQIVFRYDDALFFEFTSIIFILLLVQGFHSTTFNTIITSISDLFITNWQIRANDSKWFKNVKILLVAIFLCCIHMMSY